MQRHRRATLDPRHQGLLIGITLLVGLPALSCGPSPALQKGARIRLTAPDQEPPRIIGTLDRVERDHLLVRPADSDETLQIPRESIISLEIGSRSRKTGIGALIGAVVLGIAGTRVVNVDDCYPEPEACYVIGAVMGAVPGALLGATVGAFIRGQETWNPVPLDRVRGDRR